MSPVVAVETMAALLQPRSVERMLARLRCAPDERLGEPRLASLWVKPGRYFNAVYDLDESSSGPTPGRTVSLFALGASAANRARRGMGQHDHTGLEASGPGCAKCSSEVTPEGVLVQLFPFDYRLPTLRACHDQNVVSRAMGAPVERLAAMTYRAGMRCQIEYTLEDGRRVFGKVAFEREPGKSFRKQQGIHEALCRDAGELKVARPDRYIENLRLSVIGAVSGASLDEAYPGDAAAAVLPRVARALHQFHGLDPAITDRVHGVREEVALLTSWVALISALLPEVAGDLAVGLEHLKSTAPNVPGVLCLVHRDFFDKQVMVSGERVALIDLDTAGGGEPEIDLANFCVHLRLRARQATTAVDDRSLIETFLRAYPGRFSVEKFDWYRRATCLRLACVYALRKPWQFLVPGLIAETMPEPDAAGRAER